MKTDLDEAWSKAVAARAPLIDEIRRHHRRRRFAMKIQQKLDRALESFIRVNATEWQPEMDEEERKKINAEVKAMIKKIRDGGESEYADIVRTSDDARAPADAMRDVSEKHMAKLAKGLPAFAWIESIHGAGELGLATIVAEAGELGLYPNPAKLWSRLGFAPYDGLAGSTWKRDKWRPRELTKEEWIEHPFSGQRYALMHQIILWLVNAQWIGKAKSESGEGEPNGPFGEIYDARRKYARGTHPDWTDQHRRMDALRITMKEFLKQLYAEWNKDRPLVEGLPPPRRRAQQVMRAKNPPKKKNAPRRRRSERPRAEVNL